MGQTQGAPKRPDVNLRNPSLADELKKRLSVPGEYPDDIISPDGIRIPRPPMFRKETTVVGTTLARDVERLSKIVPEIRGRASLVSPGYTTGMLDLLMSDSDDTNPDLPYILGNMPKLAIAGLSDPDRNELYVDEDASPKNRMDTLAHEYQHLMGYKGKGASGATNLEAKHPYPYETGSKAGDLFYPPVTDDELFKLLLDAKKKRSGSMSQPKPKAPK